MKFKEFLDQYTWINSLFWIVATAIISIAIERSCNKIIPDEPIIVKEISDTVIIMHSYDFGNINDSTTNLQLKNRLENIELAEKYEEEVIKQDKLIKEPNSILLRPSFPNMKGYSLNSATPYFTFEMSPLTNRFIEFKITFLDRNIIKDIYCLTLKVFKIEDDKHVYQIDQYYHINGTDNLIRIANSLPKGKYEFCIGFIFEEDIRDEYPEIYQVRKVMSI